jgi:hypothetical protein
MAELSRQFLTAGPIPMGDIASGAIAELTKAIDKLSNNNTNELSKVVDLLKGDKVNTEKVVAILTTLRQDFIQAAKDPSQKGITPELQRQLAEALVALKGIGELKELNAHLKKFVTGAGNQALTGKGVVGTGVTVGATAIDPGLGLLVKAAQENAHAIKETFHVLKEGFHLTISVFKGIHRFFSPHTVKQRGFMSASGSIVGGNAGCEGIDEAIMKTALATALLKKLPSIGKALGMGLVVGLGGALIGAGLFWLYNKIFGKSTVADDEEELKKLSRTTPSFDTNPNTVPSDTVPASQSNSSVSTGPIEGGVHLLGGFDAVSADQQKADTVIKFMQMQTELLAEILRTLQKGNIVVGGGVKFLAEGGNVPPHKKAVVGERGPEHVRSRDRSEVVTKPSVVQAKDSPVTVTPVKGKGGAAGGAGASGSFAESKGFRETVPSEYVSPIGNPNVNQEVLRKQVEGPGYIHASIRMNNPGAISDMRKQAQQGDPYMGGVTGDVRSPGEGGRYVRYNTPEEGIQAQTKLLLKYSSEGKDTIRKIITGGWADRGQPEYIANLSKHLGISPDTKLDLTNKDTQYAFQTAQSGHEGGSSTLPYTEETYRRAIYGTDQENVSRVNQDMPWPRVPDPGKGKAPKWKDVIPVSPPDSAVAAQSSSPSPLPSPYLGPQPNMGRREPQAPQGGNINIPGPRASLDIRGDMPTASDMHHGIAMLDDTAHRIQTEDHEEERPQALPHPTMISPSQSPSGPIFSDVGMATLGGQGFS